MIYLFSVEFVPRRTKIPSSTVPDHVTPTPDFEIAMLLLLSMDVT